MRHSVFKPNRISAQTFTKLKSRKRRPPLLPTILALLFGRKIFSLPDLDSISMRLYFFLLTSSLLSLPAEPLRDSWFTELSGRYARIYPDNEALNANSPVTTWSRGQGVQSQPTYAGVNEIAEDTDYVYIRTTGLPFHIMGPWFGETGNLFPNYPANTAATFRFLKNPNYPVNPADANNPISRTETGGGPIGYFIDGVAMFDSRDAFSYSTSDGQDGGPQNPNIGDDIWLRDAYVNEGVTFDSALAHQAGALHHYHANAPGLRHLVGDSVDYDFSSNSYTENFDGNHSPILAWCRDGIPVYGPYGYSDPTDSLSPVRRMISGYQKRDGSNGSTDLIIATGNLPTSVNSTSDLPTGRTTLPSWALRNSHLPINDPSEYGPPVSLDFPIGHYLEDYAYKGDLTNLSLYQGISEDGIFNMANHFDLNEYNVRFCVTPDFPNGTWAYFMNIEADGTPAFPYNIGRYFFGDVSNNANSDRADIPSEATTVWEGGPEKALAINDLQIDEPSGDITLSWSSAEGGHYTVERSSDLTPESWIPLGEAEGTDAITPIIDPELLRNESRHFYRVGLDSIDAFDDTGFVYDDTIVEQPELNNVLLLILDDWGLDASELYNTDPNATLARMPNLKGLLFSDPNATPSDTPDRGLLFTRGYAQPICSPTRASFMTGRHPSLHGVLNPTTNNTLPASELTFPEIITVEAPEYGLAAFGKWHLGSGNTGPTETGGWPNFAGIQTGGVNNYGNWTKLEIVNGGPPVETNNFTTYTTTDQVNEAESFINAQGTNPWIISMGFNAPHDPFHDPAPFYDPGEINFSVNSANDFTNYIRMQEALDYEIGRLLASIDLSRTNIIVVGDNGSPSQTAQTPAGTNLTGRKGDLAEGGIHVPFFATGPDVLLSGTNDTLVQVSDLFSTILDVAHVNISAATSGINLHSYSLLPVFNGTDTADRTIISERFDNNANRDGRAIILDDWPQYKLISIQDVLDPNDTPSYQMFEIGSNGFESQSLTLPPASGTAHEEAYNALLAFDQSLDSDSSTGGGDDGGTDSSEVTLYLEMPEITGAAGVPRNENLNVDLITIDPDPNVSGDEFSATYVARYNQNNIFDQFWVRATVTSAEASLIDTDSSIVTVDYPDNPNSSAPRVFDAIRIIISPSS